MRLKCDEPREDGQENKGERDESDGSRQNKRTHFLLCQFLVILLCGLLVLSGAQERLSLLYKSENNNNNSETFLFFYQARTSPLSRGQKQNLTLCFDLKGRECRAAWRRGWLAPGCWDQKINSQSASSAPCR